MTARTGPFMGHQPNFAHVETVTGAANDLSPEHLGGILLVNHSSGTTLTVLDVAGNYPDIVPGEWVRIVNYGAGAVTVAKDDDNNVRVDATYTLVLGGQYSVADLIYLGNDEWVLTGDLVAAG